MKGKPQWLVFAQDRGPGRGWSCNARCRKLESALTEEAYELRQDPKRPVVIVTVYPHSRQWHFTPRRGLQVLNLEDDWPEKLICAVTAFCAFRFKGKLTEWTFTDAPTFAMDIGRTDVQHKGFLFGPEAQN